MALAKNAGKIGGLTFLSRIFGLIRDQIFAALIGAGFFADAFIIAFRIPNLLRDLFAEGALSNAFVPTFTKTRLQESEESAWQVVRLLFAWILIIVGALTLIMVFMAPQIVQLIAPGFEDVEGKKNLTILLTQIMSPFLLFVSLASVLMGIHNSYSRYSLPALAPVFFNWVSIACGLIIWWVGFDARYAVIGWSIGTLLGGFAQFAIQLPPFIRAKKNIWPSFKGLTGNVHVKHIFLLMIPSVIALSGTQINILVNSILASLLEQGAPSWLNYAFRLMQLPIGVFGVAISVVALTQASQDVASNQHDQFNTNVRASVQLSYLLTIPCAVGLWVLAEPIIQLIYQRGAFTHTDTLQTAQALMYYAIGLPFYASVKVKAPIFFTIKSSRVPMIASLVGVGFNIVFNILIYKKMGHRGLALGTSLGVMLNSIILTIFYHHKTKTKYSMAAAYTRVKIIIAALVMGGFAHVLWSKVYIQDSTNMMEIFIYPLLIIFVSGLLYMGILSMWNVTEMRNLINAIQRRLTR